MRAWFGLRTVLNDQLLFLFIPLLFLCWYSSRSLAVSGVTLWVDLQFSMMRSALVIAPLVAAISAWALSTSHPQRRRGEIVEHSDMRLLLLFKVAITTIGAWLCYSIFVSVFGVVGATWGAPEPVALLSALMLLAFAIALGAFFGRFLPIVPAIIGSGFLAWVMCMRADELMPGWLYDFTPNKLFTYVPNPLATPWPTIGPAFILLYGALTVGLLVAPYVRDTPWLRAAMALLVVFLLTAGVILLNRSPDNVLGGAASSSIEYEWECAGEAIEVCLHPAYSANLDETLAAAEGVFQPVAGIAGVPSLVYQFAPDFPVEEHGAVLPVYFEENGYDWLASQYARHVALRRHDPSVAPPEWRQVTLYQVLMLNAGVSEGARYLHIYDDWVDPSGPDTLSCAKSVLNLTQSERRAWLEEALDRSPSLAAQMSCL